MFQLFISETLLSSCYFIAKNPLIVFHCLRAIFRCLDNIPWHLWLSNSFPASYCGPLHRMLKTLKFASLLSWEVPNTPLLTLLPCAAVDLSSETPNPAKVYTCCDIVCPWFVHLLFVSISVRNLSSS